MKLEDLVSKKGLTNLSDDELLQLVNDIRKDRTTRKPTPAAKKTRKSAEAEVLNALGDLSADDAAKLLALLGED